MLRVLVGENDVESGFREAADTRGTVGWVVPKAARPGDEAVFLFHHSLFLGTGTILTSPKPGQHGRRSVAVARVGKLKRFQRPLPIADVAEAIPEWAWTTYPRSFTTPSREVAAKLMPLLAAAARGSVGTKVRGASDRAKAPAETYSSREVTGGHDEGIVPRDPRGTAAHWNELFSPEHRVAAARALSRSLLAAHALKDTCWTVTLGKEFIRLNVGVPLALTVADDECQLIVRDDGVQRELKKAGLAVERQQRFETAPGTVSIAFAIDLLAEVHGRAWRSHVSAMEIAAKRQPVSPHSGYSVALVSFLREQGYDVPDSRSPKALLAQRQAPAALRRGGTSTPPPEPFDPESVEDGRRRILASIIRRQGQGEFRQAVLQAYGFSCAITGCDVPEVLEAAHITPYAGDDTNHVQNGLLLRADLHTLFDLGLLCFDREWRVRLDASLKGTSYWTFNGMPLRLPEVESNRPSAVAVDRRREATRGA